MTTRGIRIRAPLCDHLYATIGARLYAPLWDRLSGRHLRNP